MTNLTEIKEKLRHIEQEITAVREAIEQLEAVPPNGQQPVENKPSAPGRATAEHQEARWPDSIRFVDKEPLRKAVDELFERMGIADVEPIGAEKLQEQMRQHGIKPEDCIGSRGIIEMREE
ncbi:MAG: hypothetical protein M3347_18760 [Armatimonadota bacterium]|nr:hypothetical protein [Armatimonadota bacterium]